MATRGLPDTGSAWPSRAPKCKAGRQAGRQAGSQAARQPGSQAGRKAGRQAGRQAASHYHEPDQPGAAMNVVFCPEGVV